MAKIILNITCTLRSIKIFLNKRYSKIVTKCLFYLNNIHFGSFRTRGIPLVIVSKKSKGIFIGSKFAMNNGLENNAIGIPQKCTFLVSDNCSITIGNNVGISQTALIAHADITIKDNVKIGGGTNIYTSDFHSLDPGIRSSVDDKAKRVSKPVVIENDVFIGARCLILKGVHIGEKTIIGAGSVVAKSIPAGEIWAGNPARFIRKL